ncbi:MAG: pentapeptide repeat-containing protein [Acetobacteraceae bacterium]
MSASTTSCSRITHSPGFSRSRHDFFSRTPARRAGRIPLRRASLRRASLRRASLRRANLRHARQRRPAQAASRSGMPPTVVADCSCPHDLGSHKIEMTILHD